MAVENGFILFKEYQAQFLDNDAVKRPSNYSLTDFWEEIDRQCSDFPDYSNPLVNTTVESHVNN